MYWLKTVGRMETEAVTLSGATVAATKATLENCATGRFAVEVQAVGSDVYAGNENVTADNGFVIKTGESKLFPVNRVDAVYITGSGKAIVVDYYDG